MAGRGSSLFVFGAWIALAVGCGARTDMQLFDDVPGGGGSSAGGAQSQGGSFSSAGFAATGNGNPGGGVGVGGGFPTAGSFGVGGSFGSAGDFGVGGTFSQGGFSTAGSFGTGGSFTEGGSFGTAGGFGAGGSFGTGGAAFGGSFGMAGSSATGGSGGFTQLCVDAAGTSCAKCLCTSCSAQLDSCFGDPACLQVFACVGLNKCQNLACVVKCAGTSGGQATLELLSLAACSDALRSSCGCN